MLSPSTQLAPNSRIWFFVGTLFNFHHPHCSLDTVESDTLSAFAIDATASPASFRAQARRRKAKNASQRSWK
jgi:hypothetical protein